MRGAPEGSRVDVSRLQNYLRRMAATAYDAVPLPGFTLFFHATNDRVHLNYAIPNTGAAAHASSSIAALGGEFESRGRTPRLEFVEEYAPRLPAALRAAGFREEYRGPAMARARGDGASASDLPGFTIQTVGAGASDETLRAMVTAQVRGFGAGDEWRPSGSDVAELRAFLASGQGFVGTLGGDVVCVAQLAAPHDGMTELVGVATLPAYRRRGMASAVSAVATAHAFESGMDAVCLSAGDEASACMYQRVGYRTVATMLAYSRE